MPRAAGPLPAGGLTGPAGRSARLLLLPSSLLPLAQATIPEQVRSILQREGLGGFYHGMGRCCSAARGPGGGTPPRPPGTDGEAGDAPAGTKMFQSVFAAALLYTIKDELAARTRTAIAGPALRAAPAR